MIIANPLYDVVFKRLMENEKVAKFFIGTLLDETIENIEVKPQELTYTDEFSGISIFRLDFVATIKTASGEFKKILIEIQKAKNYADLMRFRNYLAEHYKREEMIDNEKVVLPITTIYVLGFKLPEIKTACLKVERSICLHCSSQLAKTSINILRFSFLERASACSIVYHRMASSGLTCA